MALRPLQGQSLASEMLPSELILRAAPRFISRSLITAGSFTTLLRGNGARLEHSYLEQSAYQSSPQAKLLENHSLAMFAYSNPEKQTTMLPVFGRNPGGALSGPERF